MSSDWVMVIITAVYVVATIFICCANIKSAQASREQLVESKKQFDENKRLQVMPFFDIKIYPNSDFGDSDIYVDLPAKYAASVHDTNGIDMKISIENIGLGTARNISYIWETASHFDKTGILSFKTIFQKEEHAFSIDISAPVKEKASFEYEACLIIQYSDLLGNTYNINIEMNFLSQGVDKFELKNYKINEPKFIDREQNNV
jgi:hypothetical protein